MQKRPYIVKYWFTLYEYALHINQIDRLPATLVPLKAVTSSTKLSTTHVPKSRGSLSGSRVNIQDDIMRLMLVP